MLGWSGPGGLRRLVVVLGAPLRNIGGGLPPGTRRYTRTVSVFDHALRAVLEADPSVHLAVLFGSAARGEDSAVQDLDVGVLASSAARMGRLQVGLERATGRRVDLVALDEAPALLRFEVTRDGRVLVERAPHLWSDFKAKAMVDWWDWAPTARLFHRAAVRRLQGEASRGQR